MRRDLGLDIDRLAAICARFSSSFEGERATAAAMADRMVRGAGLTWADLLRRVSEPDAGFRESHRPRPSSPSTDWAALADAVLGSGASLNEREETFLSDMARMCRRGVRPTEKQREWLRSLHQRAVGGPAHAA